MHRHVWFIFQALNRKAEIETDLENLKKQLEDKENDENAGEAEREKLREKKQTCEVMILKV